MVSHDSGLSRQVSLYLVLWYFAVLSALLCDLYFVQFISHSYWIYRNQVCVCLLVYLQSTDTATNLSSHTPAGMIDPLGIKKEQDQKTPQLLGQDRRDDERPYSKEPPRGSSTPRISSVASSSSTPAHDELSSRGFQPYRAGEGLTDPLRHAQVSYAAAYPSLDPMYSAAAAAAAYQHALVPPNPYSHPAFR